MTAHIYAKYLHRLAHYCYEVNQDRKLVSSSIEKQEALDSNDYRIPSFYLRIQSSRHQG